MTTSSTTTSGPATGSTREPLAAPVDGPVVSVEVVEALTEHDASIRGLPGTHLNRPEPLGLPELRMANRQRHNWDAISGHA